jgi:hypothetical protein
MRMGRGDTYDAQAACYADRTCQLSIAHPLHATLYNRHCTKVKLAESCHDLAVQCWNTAAWKDKKITSPLASYAQLPGQFGLERHGMVMGYKKA